MLNSATSYSPSLAEAGTGKCSLMNQVSSGIMTMSVIRRNVMPIIFSASNHSTEMEDGYL